MGDILTAPDYPAIRAAIGTTVDANMVPDSIIDLPIYLGVAEDTVKERAPLWATYAGTDLRKLKNATIYLTAAFLAPAVPHIITERFGDYAYTRDKSDWDTVAEGLRSRYEAEIADLLNTLTATGSRPTMFTVASRRRAY